MKKYHLRHPSQSLLPVFCFESVKEMTKSKKENGADGVMRNTTKWINDNNIRLSAGGRSSSSV
jgi:hypothetical protein